jgi:tripeptide aminopeptidase
MNKKRLVDEFCKLVTIDSPSFHEREMAEILKKYLLKLGFEVYEDNANEHYNSECGNIYGYLKGTMEGEPLLFSAHMDTVGPAIGKKAILKEDGRIESDGTTVLGADDLSGIVAILEAIRTIRENNLEHRSIEVFFSIAEELYLKGSFVADYSKFHAKEAYVLDLTGPVGTAAYIAPTVLRVEAKIHGKAAHAGFEPEKGINSIVIASNAIGKLELGWIDKETTANIGIIEGGLATNIVPQWCTVVGETRSSNHEKALAQAEKMKQIFMDSAKAYGGTCEITMIDGGQAYEVDKNHKVVKRFEEACEELNIKVDLIKTFGGSDNNIFFHKGITGIVIACGMNKVHSCNEYTTVDELVGITEIVGKLMTSKY